MSDRRPTVVLLITTFDIGGAERAYVHLARGLAARGWRVIAACLQARSGAVARELEDTSVRVVDLGMQTRADVRVLSRLVHVLRQERADVLYTFLIHAHLIGRFCGRLAHTPVILSSQQTMGWEGKTTEWLNRTTARWCTAVVGVSQQVSSYLSQRVGIPAGKIVTIYNCVDVMAFDQGPRSPRRGPATVGCIARLDPAKDHDTLLEAFALVRTTHPDARLLLAGTGSERRRLEQRVETLGLARAVEFLGHVTDIRGLQRRLDVFVLSSHVEGFPVAVLEALAARLPVVATRVGGNEEAIVDGAGGLLVPPGDPPALARAIIRLLDDPETARTMGERGHAHVVEHFGLEAMLDAHDALIQRLRYTTSAPA